LAPSFRPLAIPGPAALRTPSDRAQQAALGFEVLEAPAGVQPIRLRDRFRHLPARPGDSVGKHGEDDEDQKCDGCGYLPQQPPAPGRGERVGGLAHGTVSFRRLRLSVRAI